MANEEVKLPKVKLPKVKLYWFVIPRNPQIQTLILTFLSARLNQSRSQRILWLLEELKVPYEVQVFHRDKQMLAPPELQKIHPLGKSPVVSVTPVNGGEPIILAESGHITEYLTAHLPEGRRLLPRQWKDGLEGQVGGETEGWMRHQYYMHYCEGSFMPFLVMSLVIERKFCNYVSNK